MSFQEINLKLKYRSSEHDVARVFFNPILERAIFYKRAVGYFSSTALITVTKGLTGLARNNGKIQLIASPNLQEEDIKAINKGFEERDKLIEKVLLESIFEPNNYFEEERLNLLVHLIAQEKLDIKIAFLQDQRSFMGLYHEKIGIVEDKFQNKIAFTGSLNDSQNAFFENFESIDVFCSWKGEESKERVIEKENDFDMLWKNKTNKLHVISFPTAVRTRLKQFKKNRINYEIDKEEQNYLRDQETKYEVRTREFFPQIPEEIELYDYQKQAIENWKEKGFKGIFSMATGTGKTITALAGLVDLYNVLDKKLGIVIVCPFQHLVEQWVGEIKNFNMHPIIGYSKSSQKKWKKRLYDSIVNFNLGIKDHFCFITTNATYASDFVQKQIGTLSDNVVIVVDEAHNFGAHNLSKKLQRNIPYRLALSATIERFYDPEGTEKLFDYFGDECIDYPIEKAIQENKLSRYYYYPIITYLTKEELDYYKKLSRMLGSHVKKDSRGRIYLTLRGQQIAIKRARFVAGGANKIDALKEQIEPYKNESFILVYCGATNLSDPDYEEGIASEEDLRQITVVSRLLGEELGMNTARFTSQESPEERRLIKEEFAEGSSLQALVAIRCLDEGFDMPDIRKAFILASSRNPKEYIQRRGRVLRLSPGKNFAEIYDFITLPRPLDEVKNCVEEEVRFDRSLAKKEADRIEIFAKDSINPAEGISVFKKIETTYDLNNPGRWESWWETI